MALFIKHFSKSLDPILFETKSTTEERTNGPVFLLNIFTSLLRDQGLIVVSIDYTYIINNPGIQVLR